MNSRIHNTATKMGVGAFLSPFQGSRGRETTQGSAFGSTPGYIPAAASRLKGFAILPDTNAMPNTVEGYFRRSPRFWISYRIQRTAEATHLSG